jgi:hypothetical protein
MGQCFTNERKRVTRRRLVTIDIDLTLSFQLNPGGCIVRDVVTDADEHRLTARPRKRRLP